MSKFVFLFQGGGDELFFRRALKNVQEAYPVEAAIFDTMALDSNPEELEKCLCLMREADFCYLSLHGGIPYFRGYEKVSGALKAAPAFIYSEIEDENPDLIKIGGLDKSVYEKLLSYYHAGGEENLYNFLLTALSSFCGVECSPEGVTYPKRDGIYGLKEGQSEEERLYEIENSQKPVIGVIVHFHFVRQGDTGHIDALCDAIRQNGGEPLAVYTNMMPDTGFGGLNETIDKYFIGQGGRPLVDALIVTVGHSLTALSAPGRAVLGEDVSVFERIGVPIIQAMTTFFSYEEWKESLSGLDSMMLCGSVYQPEFDGQIISIAFSCSETVMTADGARRMNTPIPGRPEKAARLALNWARLRRTPMSGKRIAIILHNQPPRADMIGCAYGLDTPESVFGMVEALKAEGLKLDFEFSNGQEIIQKITQGLTNDSRFLSPEEMLSFSEATVAKDQYISWYENLPENVKSKLERDWGKAPGEFMAVDGEILVPGIHNGNLFIGLQPPRAFEEKAEEMYHSTDLVCPHQYIAFYRYLREVFDAHAIVHVGTHGTLEWLPGKEIGLSEECFPEVALGEMPHIYPYIIDVPGEGAQAKRRSGAVIIDHLIPSMTDSGLYGELSAIDDAIAQFTAAKINDPGKTQSIAERVWELTEGQSLDADLGLSKSGFFSDLEGSMEKIHLWLGEIKATKIKNGLHIFGKPPEGKFYNAQDSIENASLASRYTDMLRLLVNIRNGDVPSIREAMAEALGYQDAADDRLIEPCAAVMQKFSERGYRDIDGLINELSLTGPSDKLKGCLSYVANALIEKLDRTSDEVSNFMKGVRGEFVPQGPSGSPSRGSAHILPTGRNFYMIDPTAVPSRASWGIGGRLASELIEKHEREQGALPESVAIVVYSGETIKTSGDDIAEILKLYGVRPVWFGSTDRVIGLEAIPLEELGRPRIDVTLRISGLFRDTFPNLIERIEDAVNLVASLDEPHNMNFVKKHIDDDMQEFIRDGMSREQAFDMASLRVFGCPPGTYGAGVDIMVNSKKWETSDDLGRAYINWSSHAYSRKIHGAKLEKAFERRMAITDATVKNISSFESDMLDDDDYYNYHGGLIAAVKKNRGSAPASYSTNAGDPDRLETRTIKEDAAKIMRSRIANPKWAKGLMEHGFRGAQEMSAMVDFVFGWDATADIIDGWMYDKIAEEYLFNEEISKWVKEVNPWALHAMSERLLEAAQRGMWDASEETLERLKEIFLSIEGDLEGGFVALKPNI